MKLDSVWAATVASLLAEEEEKRAAVAAEPAAKKASEMDALAEQNRLSKCHDHKQPSPMTGPHNARMQSHARTYMLPHCTARAFAVGSGRAHFSDGCGHSRPLIPLSIRSTARRRRLGSCM